VLVIDDEDIIGAVLRIVLPHHHVLAAEGGREGLLLAETLPPDVIVLDLMMPVLDGYAVLRELRGEMDVDVPILILTAVGNREDHRLCLDAGATQVMTKPFDPGVVAQTIDGLLARAAS